MEPPVKRIGDVTIERVTTSDPNPKNDDSSIMNFDTDSDSETLLSEDDLNLDPPNIDLDDKNHPSSSSELSASVSQSVKRKNDSESDSADAKKTKTNLCDSDSEQMMIDSDLHKSLSENKSPRTHLSDNEDSEYDSEEDSDNEDPNLKIEAPIDKITDLGETSQKSEDVKLESSDYDYDITEKLKEMGEISVETVKKGDKPRKSDTVDETENEISVMPAKKDSGSDSEDKLSSEKKIGNMRRNIREVMDETQLDEATLAAQRQEMERLRRVQEQQRIIREVQRQIALNRQNNKTQHRVISLLQGNSTLIKQIPGTSSSKDAPSGSMGPTAGVSAMGSQGGTGSSGTIGGKIGGTVLVKLPNGETKPMTRITKSGAPFEVVRLQKGALQGKVQRNLIPIKKTSGGNLTPSVSIAPVSKKIEPKIESDSDSEISDSEKKVRKVAGKPKDVVTISSSSDDDCIVLSEDEPEEPEPEEDPCNSGMHTNDAYNVPDEQGRVLINVGHPENEAEIFLAPQIARVIKPHQIGGVRFLFDNVIESTDRFSTSTGFGCILAHSMGLGKTLQIVCFSDIFLRHTDAKTILCIMPINTLQNWMAEFNMWLPKDPSNSPLLSHGEVRPRNFNIYVLNDSHKTLAARAKVIQEWSKEGGVLLIGYELYRLLSLRRNPKSKKKKKPAGGAPDRPETPEDEEKNKSMFEEIHEALVKPGPDLVICDEGHRIKNSHASISQALKQIRSKRRIVLTGYPLQNNLLEYWCMVDFVRPNYLGTKTEFSNMFERPIQNGQCIDSTPQDIRLMRYRAHVLHSLLEGFVQRRSHAVLQTSLPQKEEYVLLVRMTEFQRKLYDTFMNEVVRTKTVPNPLKAFAVCCKIWNHPDVLYYFLKKQTAGEAVDLDLEEVAGTVPGAQTPTQTTPKKGSSRSKGKKEKKTAASKSSNSSSKPAASVTPNTNATTTISNSPSSTTTNPPNVPTQMSNQFNQPSQTMPPPNMSNIPPNPVQNPPNYQQMNQNYPNAPYPYPQQNYNQYSQNGEYYNQNQTYPNNYNPNYYPNQEYGGFYPENKPDGYNMHGYQQNDQNYWQNNQQNNQYYQNNGSQNDYYQQQNYNNQWNQYNQNYQQNNLYPNSNAPYPQNQAWNDNKTEFPNDFNQDPKQETKMENIDNKSGVPTLQLPEGDGKELKTDDKMKIDSIEEEKKQEPELKDETDDKEMKEVDIKNAELTAAALVKKEDPGIPYDWAHELMKGYLPGCIENSAKMEIFFCILQESMALGDRILLFSQSLFTLNLIEEFLQKYDVPGTSDKWAKNKHYYRLDGSTSALEREKLINEYNSNPNIHLFLVSTRAGSLGINLVGANRVIVFDASWNPCHDTQAVCRVYRYGQKKPCFVYRVVMDNCLEKKIYDRQINKQGMADRVVDECNPDAHLSMKDVTNLCWDDEKESEVKDFSNNKDKYIDVVMQKVLDAFSTRLSKEPFQHESLLIDRKEKKLSQAEKRLAKRSYELEKQANINSRPAYSYYNSGSGQGLQIRAIRSADGSVLQNKPVASVRPMQSEQLVRDLGRPGGAGTTGRSRWIPAEVWQRQGMTAQEMTLPLDVVIPTNSPDRGSIVLKAGQKVLVLKSPKGIYMQLECGKIVAIKTAFKVRGGKAPEKGDEGSKEPSTPTTILKKVPQGANTSKSGNVPLPLKNNTAITVIPKGGQQRIVKPFTQGVTKLNMRSIRQPVPNLVGRQVPMRLGGPRFTGKIQSIHRKVQLAKAKPYNLDKTDAPSVIDPAKIKSEPIEPEVEPHVVPSSDEEIPPESHQEKKPESPVPSECADSESFPIADQFSESEKSLENLSENSEDRRPSTESYPSSDNFPVPENQFPNPEMYPALEQFSQQKHYQYPQSFEKFPPKILQKELPPLVETKKAVPTFQVQNPPMPISSPIVHESGNTNRSLKNYRHNFASQKATKAQIKSAPTSSALHQLEQTTSSIGENKLPFQESLDNITNSYGNPPNDGKSETETVIDLDDKNDADITDNSQISSVQPPSNIPNKLQPSTQPKPEIPPSIPLPLPQAPPQGPIQPPPPPVSTIHPQQPPHSNPQQQEFPPASYGGYYGYGGPPVQPYPPPPQGYYPAPEMGPFADKTKERDKGAPPANAVNTPSAPSRAEPPQTTAELTSVQTTPPVQTTPSVPPPAPSVPSTAPITSGPATSAAASNAPPGAHGGPTGGTFAPYGQPGMPPPPHGGYDMMYGQQNQYGANYPGLPYPNQPNYQPPYQQYDQNYPPGNPGTPNMYSAFHRPEVHHQYPTDPYGQYRNYPPQYGYPPPGSAPHGQYPGGPTAGYDYQYNAGGFPPPPPPFVGPYTGLPNNNAVP